VGSAHLKASIYSYAAQYNIEICGYTFMSQERYDHTILLFKCSKTILFLDRPALCFAFKWYDQRLELLLIQALIRTVNHLYVHLFLEV